MSTRGIAVISGSNTVVARILENGTAVFGADKPIDLRISGNLVVNLTGSSTGYLYVDSQGSASITSALIGNISASTVVVVPSGNLSSINVQAALEELQLNIDVVSASAGNVPNSALQNSSINLNSSNIVLGGTGSVGIIREIQAGSNIGVLNGTSPTASIFLSSSLTGLTSVQATTISGTTATFSILTASVISASSYLGITAGSNPGGPNQSVQFNSGSSLSGSSNLIYNFTTNTLSGTTAQFTSITGNLLGTSSFASSASNATTVTNGVYTNANNTFTGINTFNSYITGSITGSDAKFASISGSHTGSGAGLFNITASGISNFTSDVRTQFSAGTGIAINSGVISASNIPLSSLATSSFILGSTNITLGTTTTTVQGITVLTGSTITGSTALFTSITGNLFGTASFASSASNASTVTNGVYLNSNNTFTGVNTFNNYITGSITGSDAKFTSISGSHTGSGAGLFNLTASGISNFTSDVRAQFSAGTGIVINSGVISASNVPNTSLQNSSINLNGNNVSLGGTGSVGIIREIQAGSNIGITGGTSATASIFLSSSLTGLTSVSATTISGTTATFSILTASVISASSYIGIVTGSNVAGINQSVQFNSGSTLSGSSNLIYNYTTNTLSGTTSQFTTITASNITIGEPEDGTYTDGLFTTFTSLTPIGLVVDRFNEVLKGLAPSQAPSLANLERNTAGGSNAILSFGATSPTASYFNVTASLAGLANTDIGGTYSVINGSGSNPIRLGVFTALTALTATLNNNTTANAGSFTNYPAKAFNVSSDGIGSFIVEMNNVILTPTGSTTTTASYLANNFNLSLANTASFISTGLGFDLFRHRTGSVSIPTASWRLGENYFKVTQVSSLGTQVTNYIDWVYDPQAATGNSVYAFTTTSSSFAVSGLKALSGVKYYQTCSFNFTSSINNFYKNVYATTANGGITFGNLTTGLTSTAFASTPAPVTSNDILQRSSLHTLAGVRILSGTLTSTMTVNNTLGKTGTTVLTTPTILFDNVNTANSNTLENFCFEDFRVISASYDTQVQLTGAPVYGSGSNLSASELAVYSGSVIYPTRMFNSGNISGSGIVYMTGSQPNYSGSIQDRYYLRKFVNGASTLATFNLVLTGSNVNFIAFGGSLTSNNIKITVKVPGKTGWRDVLTAAPANTTAVALNDNVGCLAGSAPANITTVAGRSIAINLLTEAIGANESYIVRILASKDWTGYISKIQIA